MKNYMFWFIVVFCSCTMTDKHDHCVYKVNLKNNDNLFIKSFHWGVNGNNRIVLISTDDSGVDDISNYNGDKEFVYKGDFPMYFQMKSDTLYVYTYLKSAIPQEFESKIIVKQIEIESRENMKLMGDSSYIGIDQLCK